MPGSLPERKLIFQLSTLVFQVLLLSTYIMSQTFPLTWKKQLENKVKTGCHPRTKHGTWKCSLGLSETPGYKLPDSSPKHGRAKIGASNSSYISNMSTFHFHLRESNRSGNRVPSHNETPAKSIHHPILTAASPKQPFITFSHMPTTGRFMKYMNISLISSCPKLGI